MELPKMTSPQTQLQLSQIDNHPSYVDPTIVEQHILTEYMLVAAEQDTEDPNKKRIIHLKKTAIDALLELHPIQVVAGKNDRYYCIGGIRSLSIARNCLPLSDSVPVTLLEDIKKEEARKRCLTDVFMTSCLSLRNVESLHRIFTLLPENLKADLINIHTGTVGIAKLLGVERETIRLWKQKKTSKTP
jgi:hypothetical protein